MRVKICLFLICCLLIAVTDHYSITRAAEFPSAASSGSGQAKNKQASSAAKSPIKKKIDACSLILKSEVARLQGEAVKETKSNERIEGALTMSHCLYLTASYPNSVSFEITQSNLDKPTLRGPKDRWKEIFHGDGYKEEREGEAEQEREANRPRPIAGIGDEAFWVGNRVIGGALYVLKNNTYLRISVGGAGKEETKINKSKALARKALKRL